MREVIALAVFLSFSGFAIFLAARGRAGSFMTAILLAFSALSGWGIANYDWVQTVKWEVPGSEAFRTQLNVIREEAVAEIQRAGDARRSELKNTVAEAEVAAEKSEAREKSLETVLESALKAEERIKVYEQRLLELYGKDFAAKDNAWEASRSNHELALLLTRVAWLLLESRDNPGDERCQAAAQGIMDSLDEVMTIVIKDPEERMQFISEVMNSIPPRQ
jgi:hypothetical protein